MKPFCYWLQCSVVILNSLIIGRLNMNWKKVFFEVLRVAIAALAGALAGGCSLIPIFNF